MDLENFATANIIEACYQLSSRKADAQTVINWTVVGQLSLWYLRAPTLDHCSLSHRSWSSVYSTISSRRSLSDNLYLCLLATKLSRLSSLRSCNYNLRLLLPAKLWHHGSITYIYWLIYLFTIILLMIMLIVELSNEVLVWLSVCSEMQIVHMVQLMPLPFPNPIISSLI